LARMSFPGGVGGFQIHWGFATQSFDSTFPAFCFPASRAPIGLYRENRLALCLESSIVSQRGNQRHFSRCSCQPHCQLCAFSPIHELKLHIRIMRMQNNVAFSLSLSLFLVSGTRAQEARIDTCSSTLLLIGETPPHQ
jgi:hypothetical protein